MTSENDYLDLASLGDVAEPLASTVESDDFSTRKTMPVGDYVSLTRSIKARRRDDGQYSFQIIFEGGLRNLSDGKVYSDRFPLHKFITTTPYQLTDRDGNPFPGTTSAVAEYLKRCGFSVKGLDAQTLMSLMTESQTIPVQCFVGRTDKAKKTEDGKWVNREPRLKTRDFNVGTKEEPVYAESVTVDGVEFLAAPTVVSFSKAPIQ